MKTAEELGITKAELDALEAVRDGLASGQYVHVPAGVSTGEGERNFNMEVACIAGSSGCGTIGCIGGWMGLQMGMTADRAAEYVYSQDPYEGGKGPLHGLFFPALYGNWDQITPEHAAQAINNFLETGDPQWPLVVPELASDDTYEANEEDKDAE